MKKIAYVCMEMLIDNLPTFAGGLGILAGDLISSADDKGYPIYGVTLINRKGYAEFRIKNKEIIKIDEEYEPLEYFKKIDILLDINLKDKKLYFTAWEFKLNNTSIYLLDTDVPENPKELRHLTDYLYYENTVEERLLKDILLGIGTLKLFDALGMNIDRFHLNESHGGFLAIELLKKYKNMEKVKEKLVFTTHSPVAGHEVFDYPLVEKFYDIPEYIKQLSPEKLNLTKVLLDLSSYANAVSWKHKVVSEKILRKRIDYITNGVYHLRWVHDYLKELYDKYIPGWREEPSKLAYASNIPKREFQKIKERLREDLIEYINANAYLNKSFRKDHITITVRRRFAEYKRFHLILWRLERLEELNKRFNIQILFSGVFHPLDEYVKGAIKWILDVMESYNFKIALILKRGVELEKYLISGSDLFLHTPRPPFEACGTSWMRAGINGVPTLASRDGGVIEAIIDDYNGWLFGENRLDPYSYYNEEKDIQEFYDKLEYVLNLYKNNYKKYLDICINAIRTIGPLFNSYRTLEEYKAKAYS